ncbi:MAG: hypothetical protein WCT07_03405 [Candidatus Paceibacterota bacterium]|jgi:hypothetical protein
MDKVFFLRRVTAINGVLYTTSPNFGGHKNCVDEKSYTPRTVVIEHLWPKKDAADNHPIPQVKM